MKYIVKKAVIFTLIIILMVLGISKLIITPTEVGILALDKVINENTSVYDISNSDMNKILEFYKGISDNNLPYPKLRYNKQIKLNTLVSQEIHILEHPQINNKYHQISFHFQFYEYDKEAYKKGQGYIMKNDFIGKVYFNIEKLGFNRWKINEVKIQKLSPVDKDGHWSSKLE